MWTLLLACAPPSTGTLSALTYNVHGLPDPLTNTPRPTAERMARIAPLLSDYDVIGLQEDFDPDNHEILVGTTPHPLQDWFDAPVAPDRFYGAGLTLLGREGTEVEVAQEHYEACFGLIDGASDCLASKGFHRMRVALSDDVEIDLINTHHEAGGGADDLIARTAQVDQVLASLTDEAIPVIFFGDFNLRYNDEEDTPLLDAYTAAGLRDACRDLACPEDDHIDHILIRDGIGVTLDVLDWRNEAHFVDEDGADLSDHPPIAIDVGWATR